MPIVRQQYSKFAMAIIRKYRRQLFLTIAQHAIEYMQNTIEMVARI